MSTYPPSKYVFTMVTNSELTQEEQMELFEALAKTKKSLTSAIRKITDEEWHKMFDILNNVKVSIEKMGTVAVELICGKCNCLMKSYQHNTTSYVSFHCDNCDISVNSPNLSEYLKKEIPN